MNVRFVHCLEHPEFDGQLKAGCECSEKMSENFLKATKAEKYVRNYEREKLKWGSGHYET